MKTNKLYLGDYFALFLGYLPHIPEHQHTTGAVCLSLGEPIKFQDQFHGDALSSRSAFLPQNLKTQIASDRELVLLICFEVESLFNQGMTDQYHYPLDRISVDLVFENELLKVAEKLSLASSIDAQFADDVTNVLVPSDKRPKHNFQVDSRIASLTEMIERDLTENMSIEKMAEGVALSTSRLSHLFREQTGLSIRRFRLWKRMKNTLLLFEGGANLTEASVRSGFTDSAHFSNACRKLLGIMPSQLMNSKLRIEIMTS